MLSKTRRVPLQSFPKNSKVVLRTKNFSAKVSPNNLTINRLGVIIGKAAGPAAKRNELKRIIMNFFGDQKNFWEESAAKNKDVVIVVLAHAALQSVGALKQELEKYGGIF